MIKTTFDRRYWGKGELEAFFGLFGDVFSKIAVIIGVLFYTEGFPVDIVMGRILPGLAVGSIMGSIIFFTQAVKLNKAQNRHDSTALPFGIASAHMFTWLFLIIIPVYRKTGDAYLAWQVGLAGCFWGGFIELAGAFLLRVIKKYIPDSALYANMVASALIWLSFAGFIKVFQIPIISAAPLFILFIALKYKKNIIKKIPNTMLVLILGSCISWITGHSNIEKLYNASIYFSFYPPKLYIYDIIAGTRHILPYLSIIIPLQISNFITTMQASQAATLTGDNYNVKRSMILDSLTTFATSIAGCPFPTTVYYGHAGWKKIEARSYYILLMCLPYLTCFLGVPLLMLNIIPYETILIFIILVGITVSSEVIGGMKKEFSSVAFLSLFPIMAQFVMSTINGVLGALGTSLDKTGLELFDSYGVSITALVTLSNGAFASSLMYAAWLAYIYEKEYKSAAITSVLLALMSFTGFIHSNSPGLFNKTAVELGIAYIITALVCLYIGKKQNIDDKSN